MPGKKTGLLFMKKQKKQSSEKASKTRKRRESFLKQYKPNAKENRLRLSYSRVKKIDLLSKKNKTSFKKTFEKIVLEKEKRTIRSLAKKFQIEKNDARLLYKTSLAKELNYKESFEIIRRDINIIPGGTLPGEGLQFPNLTQNYLGLIDYTQNFMVLPDAKIKIDIPGYSFSGTVSQFNETGRFQLRKQVESNFKEDNGEEGASSGYAVLDFLFEVETQRDSSGHISGFTVTGSD